MLEFLGLLSLVWVSLVMGYSFVAALEVSTTAKFWVAAIGSFWFALQVALSMAGAFHAWNIGPVPLVAFAVTIPPLAVAIAAGMSATVRRTLMALPLRLLVGLNIERILGLFFVLLAMDGGLGGAFPLSAGWGDMLVGALAFVLVFGRLAPRTVFWWSVLGTLDLIAAVGLGAVSANGGGLQLIHAGTGSDAIQMMPWSVIPTVIVPFFFIVHGIVFAKLRAERAALGHSVLSAAE